MLSATQYRNTIIDLISYKCQSTHETDRTRTSGRGCGKTPVSLQLPLGAVAGVVLDELLRTGTCPVTGCCLSGLFLVGEVRLAELGSGAYL